MFDYIISEEAKKIKEEVRAFVRDEVPPSLIKKMDQNEVQYPTEYLQNLGKHNLIAMRTPKEYGGRGLSWEGEVCALEEVGVLGSSLPCFSKISTYALWPGHPASQCLRTSRPINDWGHFRPTIQNGQIQLQ